MKSSTSNSIATASALALMVLFPNERALADGCPAPSFAAPIISDSGGAGLAIGDFNGDGKLDLAAANDYFGTVSVLVGNGDGTFQPAVNYDTGSLPYYVAVGEFNDDGKLDLAVANNAFAGTVSLLLGNGDGTFQIGSNYGVGLYPVSLAVADFNADGKLDLSVVNSRSENVSVLFGNGDGSLQPAGAYQVGTRPVSMAVGDFNADRKFDLAVANGSSTTISVLVGNGDGTFQPAVYYGTGSPQFVAVGEFNGDNRLDLAVANFGSAPDYTNGNVSVLLGNGDGTFGIPVNYRAGLYPRSVEVRDFNGDGKSDLAVANWGSGTVSELLGNGDGTFRLAANYGTGSYPSFVVVGDFNGDGRSDLAATHGGVDWSPPPRVSVLLNTCASGGVHLGIERSNFNLILSWPLVYTNFVLETKTSLTSTNWQGVSGVVTTNNRRCEVIVPTGQGQSYFRLRGP